jgi:hypothetical protein
MGPEILCSPYLAASFLTWPPALDGLADDLLRHAIDVHVRGVDEVDAELQGALDDAHRGRLVHLLAHGHGSQAESGHLQPSPSHLPILHAALS